MIKNHSRLYAGSALDADGVLWDVYMAPPAGAIASDGKSWKLLVGEDGLAKFLLKARIVSWDVGGEMVSGEGFELGGSYGLVHCRQAGPREAS